MTDSITDMLNRIKNAQMAKHEKTQIAFSKIKLPIAEILKKQGFISDAQKRGRGVKKNLIIYLKYLPDKSPALDGFKRVSKPGQRIYKKSGELKKVRSGFGISIVSTSKGIMLGREARKKKLGGELMLEIW